MSDNPSGPSTTSTIPHDFPQIGDNAALIEFLNSHPEMRPQESQQGGSSGNILGWTETDGVWVLRGSATSFQAFETVAAQNPSLTHNQILEKAGAVYYKHCKYTAADLWNAGQWKLTREKGT